MPTPTPHRKNSLYRKIIGTLFLLFVWTSYLLRITLSIGLMHDPTGNPAPASHYLTLALITTALVATWILARDHYERHHPD